MSSKGDIALEFSVLKTVCASNLPEVRNYLLPRLQEKHFSSATAQNLYRRITRIVQKEQYIPAWRDLASDPGLRKETRQAMRSVEARRMRNGEQIKSGYTTLDQLRKVRALYDLGANLETALEESSVDLDKVMETITKDLQVAMDGSQETPIINVGVGGNANAMVKKLLTTGGPDRIPTGFEAYDSVSKGIPRGAFVLLGATTGGGKSTMADVMADNMAMRGASAGIIPLEMNAEETMQRRISRISREPLSNLIDPKVKITLKRRKEIYRIFKAYNDRLARLGGKVSIIDPKFNATMENVLEFVKPLGLDVIFIDYIGLLSGVNGDDQWRALSAVTAYAKRWAELNGCIVVGLVQVTMEGMIRYAQAMKEHASYAWFWKVDEDAREAGFIEIDQVKARQSKMFKFLLKVDFDTMTIRDPTRKELDEFLAATCPGNEKGQEPSWKSKKKRKDNGGPDLDDEEANYERPRIRKKHRESEEPSGKVKKTSRFEY